MTNNLLYFNPNLKSGLEVCFNVEIQVEIQQQNNVEIKAEKQLQNKIFYRPICKNDGMLYEKVSKNGKYFLEKQLISYNHAVYSLYQNQLDNKVYLDINQQMINEYEENINKQEIEKYLQNNQIIDLLKPYPCESAIIFRQNITSHMFEQENTIDNNAMTYCLLYSGQDENQMQALIKQFDQFKEHFLNNIVVVVNGSSTLHQSLQGKFINHNVPSELQYDTCAQFEYTFIKDNMAEFSETRCASTIKTQFFVIHEQQNPISLLRWIYQGIFQHFSSQYCYVGDLSIQLNSEFICESKQQLDNGKYFGVQGFIEISSSQEKFWSYERSFIEYQNFLQQQMQIDSLSSLKQYHNPFFCIYNWKFIFQHINKYIDELEIQYGKGEIILEQNSNLPQIIWSSDKKQLYTISQFVGHKQLDHSGNLASIFCELADRQYSLLLSNNKYFINGSLFQGLLQYKGYFEVKFKLAMITFIYIFSPYQIFYQLTENIYARVIVAIILPFSLILSILLLIIWIQQYQLGKIKIKRSMKNARIKLTNQNNLEIKLNDKKYQYNQEQVQADDNKILLKQSNSEVEIQNIQYQYSGNQVTYFKGHFQIVQRKDITYKFQKLFLVISFISLLCSISVISDIIFIYGPEIINTDTAIKPVTMVIILIGLGVIILRCICLNENKLGGLILFSSLFWNFLITVVFSEIYHILYFSQDPFRNRRNVERLAVYLVVTVILLYMLLIAEAQTNFNGYIFIAVISYLVLMLIIDSFLIILAKLCQWRCHTNRITPDKYEEEIMLTQITDRLFPKFELIIKQYDEDLRKQKIEEDKTPVLKNDIRSIQQPSIENENNNLQQVNQVNIQQREQQDRQQDESIDLIEHSLSEIIINNLIVENEESTL